MEGVIGAESWAEKFAPVTRLLSANSRAPKLTGDLLDHVGLVRIQRGGLAQPVLAAFAFLIRGAQRGGDEELGVIEEGLHNTREEVGFLLPGVEQDDADLTCEDGE